MSNGSINGLNNFTENIQLLPFWEPVFKTIFFLIFNLTVYPLSVKTIQTKQDVQRCFADIKKKFKTIFDLYSVQSFVSKHIYPLELTEIVLDYVPNMEEQAIHQISAEIEYLTACLLWDPSTKVPPLAWCYSINKYQVLCPSLNYLSNIENRKKNNWSLSIYVEPQEVKNNPTNKANKNDYNNNDNNENDDNNKNDDNNENDDHSNDYKTTGRDTNIVNNDEKVETKEWCRYIYFVNSRLNYLLGFHLFTLCCTALTLLFDVINDSLCDKYSVLTISYRLFLRLNNSQILIHFFFCLTYKRQKLISIYVLKRFGSSICSVITFFYYILPIPLQVAIVLHTSIALLVFLPISLFGYLLYCVLAHILFMIITRLLSLETLSWSNQAQNNLMHIFFSEFYLVMGLTICAWANSIFILFLESPEKNWVNAIVYDFQQRNLFEFFDYRTILLF
jgi:hypothetical protein